MSFSKIKIYGNSDVDYVWSKSKIMTNSELEALSNLGVHTPSWDLDTVILANFNDNLSAACHEEQGLVVGYVIYRYDVDNNILTKVADISTTDYSGGKLKDYNTANNKRYRYYIYPLFENGGQIVTGQAIVSEEIETNWSGWVVIGLNKKSGENEYDVDKENIWKFDLNISSPYTLTPQYQKEFVEGLDKYAKGYSGKRNYLKGSFSSLFGDANCEGHNQYRYDSADKLQKWRDFCASSQLKLIKDQKGFIIVGDIEDTSFSIDEQIKGLPTTLSFNYIELKDYKKLKIYGLEG